GKKQRRPQTGGEHAFRFHRARRQRENEHQHQQQREEHGRQQHFARAPLEAEIFPNDRQQHPGHAHDTVSLTPAPTAGADMTSQRYSSSKRSASYPRTSRGSARRPRTMTATSSATAHAVRHSWATKTMDAPTARCSFRSAVSSSAQRTSRPA